MDSIYAGKVNWQTKVIKKATNIMAAMTILMIMIIATAGKENVYLMANEPVLSDSQPVSDAQVHTCPHEES